MCSIVRRLFTILALLGLCAVGGGFVYQAAAVERDYRSLVARGDAALAAGQTFEAIEAYSGAIGLRPASMLAHLRRGETYRQRGDLEAAVRDFRRAATLDRRTPCRTSIAAARASRKPMRRAGETVAPSGLARASTPSRAVAAVRPMISGSVRRNVPTGEWGIWAS